MTAFNHWFPPQRVVFGPGSARDLYSLSAQAGVTRPLVVCSPRAGASDAVRAALASFPHGAAGLFARVEPHAPFAAALEGAALVRSFGADGLIAFGGGSASDLAKGIALAAAEGDDIERFALRREKGVITGAQSTTPKMPVLAVPTTLSGAEVTPGFSLTRADAYKLIFRDSALACRLIVLDPDLLAGMPVALLAASGMNALAHCFEGLYSRARTPIAVTLAEEGLRLLWRGLDTRIGGGDGAEDMLVGSYYAGAAIVNARTALHHAICHKLAPVAHVSHGDANSLVLPHALRFNLPACPVEARRMAALIGLAVADDSPPAVADAVASAVAALSRRAGLRARLSELDLDRAALPEVAQRVFGEPGLAFNPRTIESADEILGVLNAAW
jgi:alcohol dehydrogenase class IV